MRARARGMTLSMVGIGLFKTQGLDEYGTAAVGCLRGAGLKATEGPAERRGGGIRTAHSHARTSCASTTHGRRCTQATHMTCAGTDKTTYRGGKPEERPTRFRLLETSRDILRNSNLNRT